MEGVIGADFDCQRREGDLHRTLGKQRESMLPTGKAAVIALTTCWLLEMVKVARGATNLSS